VIDTRATEAWEYRNLDGEEEAPGMCTRLLVKRVKSTQRTVTTTYTLDVKTLREARAPGESRFLLVARKASASS
jgi:hypothetical protein